MHEDAGRVEHGLEAARGSGQRRKDGVHGVRGCDLAVPDALLDLLDDVLEQPAAQPLTRLRQARVGEQRVGARHLPPRVVAHRYAA